MLIEVPRTDAERPFLVVGNPVKLSRVAEGPVRRFPSLGQHTDATLRERSRPLGRGDRGAARARSDRMRGDAWR